jgi:hypothetical protein
VHECGKALEVRSRPVGSRERVANVEHEASLERDQLALASAEDLFHRTDS